MTRDTFAQVGKYGLAYSLFHALFIVGFIAQGAVAISVQYCANFNTGSDNPPVTNIYQSNGACSDNCKASYAFAVVQGSTCWCSNYAPASSSSGCNEACPGYPSEKCGNTIEGLFGYIPLNKAPSGTRGGSSSSDRAVSDDSFLTLIPSLNLSRIISLISGVSSLSHKPPLLLVLGSFPHGRDSTGPRRPSLFQFPGTRPYVSWADPRTCG